MNKGYEQAAEKRAIPNGQESSENMFHLQIEVTLRYHFIPLRLITPVGWSGGDGSLHSCQ